MIAPPISPTSLSIRALRAADIPAGAELVSSLPLWQRYQYTRARCARDLRIALKRRDRITVAVAAGSIVGLAWVLPLGGFGRLPYLKLLAVAADAQGQGIGEALLHAAEAGGDLLLLVSDFNRRAQRFYAAQGFKRVGAFPGLVLPEVTELLFLKASRPVPGPARATARRAAVQSRDR